MSQHWSYEARCTKCGTEGHVFWGEGGYQDQDEWCREIWGPFFSRQPSDSFWSGRQSFEIVCAECNSREHLKTESHPVREPAELRRLWGCK
jgi:hypothetical protein